MAEGNLIGVVTVTYNSAAVLPAFLRCMAEQTHREFLLFAVDNCSADGSVCVLQEFQDERLRTIANPDNRGVAEGNNQGISAALDAGCNSVLLINNDTEFEENLVADLAAGLAAKRVGMVCPKMMYFDDPKRFWAAGGSFQPCLGYRAVHRGQDEIDRGQFDRVEAVSYAPTCCVLIRKNVFELIGLMDARYFAYSDDADFMFRAKKAGIKLMYLPQTTLLHKVGSLTGGEEKPFAIQYGTRNSAFFLLKHFGAAFATPWIMLRAVNFFCRFLVSRKSVEWLRWKEVALWRAFGMYSRYLKERTPTG